MALCSAREDPMTREGGFNDRAASSSLIISGRNSAIASRRGIPRGIAVGRAPCQWRSAEACWAFELRISSVDRRHFSSGLWVGFTATTPGELAARNADGPALDFAADVPDSCVAGGDGVLWNGQECLEAPWDTGDLVDGDEVSAVISASGNFSVLLNGQPVVEPTVVKMPLHGQPLYPIVELRGSTLAVELLPERHDSLALLPAYALETRTSARLQPVGDTGTHMDPPDASYELDVDLASEEYRPRPPPQKAAAAPPPAVPPSNSAPPLSPGSTCSAASSSRIPGHNRLATMLGGAPPPISPSSICSAISSTHRQGTFRLASGRDTLPAGAVWRGHDPRAMAPQAAEIATARSLSPSASSSSSRSPPPQRSCVISNSRGTSKCSSSVPSSAPIGSCSSKPSTSIGPQKLERRPSCGSSGASEVLAKGGCSEARGRGHGSASRGTAAVAPSIRSNSAVARQRLQRSNSERRCEAASGASAQAASLPGRAKVSQKAAPSSGNCSGTESTPRPRDVLCRVGTENVKVEGVRSLRRELAEARSQRDLAAQESEQAKREAAMSFHEAKRREYEMRQLRGEIKDQALKLEESQNSKEALAKRYAEIQAAKTRAQSKTLQLREQMDVLEKQKQQSLRSSELAQGLAESLELAERVSRVGSVSDDKALAHLREFEDMLEAVLGEVRRASGSQPAVADHGAIVQATSTPPPLPRGGTARRPLRKPQAVGECFDQGVVAANGGCLETASIADQSTAPSSPRSAAGGRVPIAPSANVAGSSTDIRGTSAVVRQSSAASSASSNRNGHFAWPGEVQVQLASDCLSETGRAGGRRRQ